MYQDHFGLYTAPFVLGPRLKFVFQSKTFEETMAHLVYGIEGGEEFILITGAIGTGKTLALQNLVAHIAPTYRVALVNVTQLDFRELLKLVLLELDVTPADGADRADLLGALKLRLQALRSEGKRCLLVIDEAQNLELETLEGVRLLTNLSSGDTVSLQVVLAGQPGLGRSIDHPDLLQLRQRIRVHYHLSTLTEDETRQYVNHRMSVAGATTEVFRPDAIREIHRLAKGVPRLINVLADKALLSAYVDGSRAVNAKHVEPDRALVVSMDEAAPAPPSAPAPAAVVAAEPAGRRRGAAPRLLWTLPALLLVLAAVWLVGQKGCSAPRAGDVSAADQDVHEAATPQADPVADPVSAPAPEQPGDPAAADATAQGDVATDAHSVDAVTVAEDAPPPGRTPPPQDDAALDDPLGQGYYVHNGSFQNLPRAQGYIDSLADEGIDAFLKRVIISGQPWYRIYLGPFPDYASAEAMDSRLRGKHPGDWSMVVRID